MRRSALRRYTLLILVLILVQRYAEFMRKLAARRRKATDINAAIADIDCDAEVPLITTPPHRTQDVRASNGRTRTRMPVFSSALLCSALNCSVLTLHMAFLQARLHGRPDRHGARQLPARGGRDGGGRARAHGDREGRRRGMTWKAVCTRIHQSVQSTPLQSSPIQCTSCTHGPWICAAGGGHEGEGGAGAEAARGGRGGAQRARGERGRVPRTQGPRGQDRDDRDRRAHQHGRRAREDEPRRGRLGRDRRPRRARARRRTGRASAAAPTRATAPASRSPAWTPSGRAPKSGVRFALFAPLLMLGRLHTILVEANVLVLTHTFENYTHSQYEYSLSNVLWNRFLLPSRTRASDEPYEALLQLEPTIYN